MKTFENSSRAYKQIGLVLAEALKGTARKSKSGDPKQKQNAAGNAEGKQGMLGKGLTTKDGKLDAESVQHNMKANMNSQNAKGSGNKARRRLAALQNSSRAYKQIGLVLAEALGHRVDEIAPLVAAAGAGLRVAGGMAAKLAAQGAKSAARLAAKGAKSGAKSLAKGAKSAAVGARNMAVDAGKDKLISIAQKKAEDELKAQSNSDTDLEEGKIMNNAYSVYSRLGHIFLEGRAEKAEASREARKRERDQVLANTLPDGTQKKGSWNWRREGTKETVRKGVKRFKKNSQTNDG